MDNSIYLLVLHKCLPQRDKSCTLDDEIQMLPSCSLFNMYSMFSQYLMSVFAAICLFRIIQGICILPGMANELWKCVMFYIYIERLVVSSCQIPSWNMSDSAQPVIEAHWSIPRKMFTSVWKRKIHSNWISDPLAFKRHKQSALSSFILYISMRSLDL